jgi:hypothetical protein
MKLSYRKIIREKKAVAKHKDAAQSKVLVRKQSSEEVIKRLFQSAIFQIGFILIVHFIFFFQVSKMIQDKGGFSSIQSYLCTLILELLLCSIFVAWAKAKIAKEQSKAIQGDLILIGEKLSIMPQDGNVRLFSIIAVLLYIGSILFYQTKSSYQDAEKDKLSITDSLNLDKALGTYKADTLKAYQGMISKLNTINEKAENDTEGKKSALKSQIVRLQKEIEWCRVNSIDIGDRGQRVNILNDELLYIKIPLKYQSQIESAKSYYADAVQLSQNKYNVSTQSITSKLENEKKKRVEKAGNFNAISMLFSIIAIIAQKYCYFYFVLFLCQARLSFSGFLLYIPAFLFGQKSKKEYIELTKEERDYVITELAKHNIKLENWNTHKSRYDTGDNSIKVIYAESIVKSLGYEVFYENSNYPKFKKIA